jgi:hypothetical protein
MTCPSCIDFDALIEKGSYFDHECSVGGKVVDRIEHKTGRDPHGAISWLCNEGFLPEPQDIPLPMPQAPKSALHAIRLPAKSETIVATYDYVDENGALLFQVMRYEPKKSRHRRPAEDGWICDVDGARRVPYPLPDVVEAAAHGRDIYVVEGEKNSTVAPPGFAVFYL